MTKHPPAHPGSNFWQFCTKALIVCFACVALASAQKPDPQQPWLQYNKASDKSIGIRMAVYNASVDLQGLLAETTITMTFQ